MWQPNLPSLIRIRPVVRINAEGFVTPLRTVRTEEHALRTMVDYVASKKEPDMRSRCR